MNPLELQLETGQVARLRPPTFLELVCAGLLPTLVAHATGTAEMDQTPPPGIDQNEALWQRLADEFDDEGTDVTRDLNLLAARLVTNQVQLPELSQSNLETLWGWIIAPYQAMGLARLVEDSGAEYLIYSGKFWGKSAWDIVQQGPLGACVDIALALKAGEKAPKKEAGEAYE